MKIGAKVCTNYQIQLQNCVDKKVFLMLKNASFLAIVAVHTAENERFKSMDFRSQSNQAAKARLSQLRQGRGRASHRAFALASGY